MFNLKSTDSQLQTKNNYPTLLTDDNNDSTDDKYTMTQEFKLLLQLEGLSPVVIDRLEKEGVPGGLITHLKPHSIKASQEIFTMISQAKHEQLSEFYNYQYLIAIITPYTNNKSQVIIKSIKDRYDVPKLITLNLVPKF